MLNAKRNKDINGVTFAGIISLTYLIFVDDVLLFGDGSVEEWGSFHSLVALFCDSSRLEVILDKTYLIYANLSPHKLLVLK